MVKRVMTFRLRDGVDPDQFWKFWEEKHAAEFKNFPVVKKYVLNRVTQVVNGEPKFWGLVEFWYDSEEIYNEARESSPVIKRVSSDGFEEQVTDRFTAWVEEKVMIDW